MAARVLIPAYAFLRTKVQTRKKKHFAPRGMGYRQGLYVPGAGLDGGDVDYTGRRGVHHVSVALPAGAAPMWTDPIAWAEAIERAERRRDSRLFRDDILGIPVQLVESGKAEEAVELYAQRIADEEGTPVHVVIHDLDSHNPHAHTCYAGRRLTPDGEAFEAKRNRAQDQPEMIDRHKEFWAEVCAEYHLELDFDGPQSETPRGHVGPRPWAIEKRKLVEETGDRIADALEEDSRAPIPLSESDELGRIATDGITVGEVLDMDRVPATRAAQRAKAPRETRNARIARHEETVRIMTDDELAPLAEAAAAHAKRDKSAAEKFRGGVMVAKGAGDDEPAPLSLAQAARREVSRREAERAAQDPAEAEPAVESTEIPGPPSPSPPPPIAIQPRVHAHADTGGLPASPEEIAEARTWLAGNASAGRSSLAAELDRIATEHLSGARAWSPAMIAAELRPKPRDDHIRAGRWRPAPVRSPKSAERAATSTWKRILAVGQRFFGTDDGAPLPEDLWPGLTRKKRAKAREAAIEDATAQWGKPEPLRDWLGLLFDLLAPLEVVVRRDEKRRRKVAAQKARDAPGTARVLPFPGRGPDRGGEER